MYFIARRPFTLKKKDETCDDNMINCERPTSSCTFLVLFGKTESSNFNCCANAPIFLCDSKCQYPQYILECISVNETSAFDSEAHD